MASARGGSCRAVAPLLARYADPDLTEAERVLLSLHLAGCPACLARLNSYRAQERRLRAHLAVRLAPRVRQAVLDQIAAGATAATPRPRAGLEGRRKGLASVAVATAACAVLLAGSLAAYGLRVPLQRVPATVPSSVANETFARPLTTTFLAYNPTRVIGAGNADTRYSAAPAPVIHRASPLVLTGTVRAVYPVEGRILVKLVPTGGEEVVTLGRGATIVLPDGGQGSLADLGVGTAIRAHCDRPTAGTTTAGAIIVLR